MRILIFGQEEESERRRVVRREVFPPKLGKAELDLIWISRADKNSATSL